MGAPLPPQGGGGLSGQTQNSAPHLVNKNLKPGKPPFCLSPSNSPQAIANLSRFKPLRDEKTQRINRIVTIPFSSAANFNANVMTSQAAVTIPL